MSGQSNVTRWRELVSGSECLSSSGKLVGLVLSLYMHSESLQCRPSFATIEARSSLARNTVRRALDDLESSGFLRVTRGRHKGWSSYFTGRLDGAAKGSMTDPLKAKGSVVTPFAKGSVVDPSPDPKGSIEVLKGVNGDPPTSSELGDGGKTAAVPGSPPAPSALGGVRADGSDTEPEPAPRQPSLEPGVWSGSSVNGWRWEASLWIESVGRGALADELDARFEALEVKDASDLTDEGMATIGAGVALVRAALLATRSNADPVWPQSVNEPTREVTNA